MLHSRQAQEFDDELDEFFDDEFEDAQADDEDKGFALAEALGKPEDLQIVNSVSNGYSEYGKGYAVLTENEILEQVASLVDDDIEFMLSDLPEDLRIEVRDFLDLDTLSEDLQAGNPLGTEIQKVQGDFGTYTIFERF